MRYLKVTILPETEEDVDPILDGLRTTIDREPFVDAEGDFYSEILSDQELLEEGLCLGICFSELEEQDFDTPFMVELLELDQPPAGDIKSYN